MTASASAGSTNDDPSASEVRIAVLGPVLVEGRTGQLIEPSGALSKALIAALALAPGGSLSTPALIDELWGEAPPRQPKGALQTLVSRMRVDCAVGLIESRGSGYVIAGGAHETDLGQATLLRDSARASATVSDHDAVDVGTTAALSLWRAGLGADLPEPLADELQSRARALRRELLQLRADARIALGRAAESVPELELLATQFPLDEAVQLQLLRALDAAGRPGDAIAAFARFRAVLREELGTSPSSAMVRLNTELLQRDNSDVQTSHAEQPIRVRIGLRVAPNSLLGRESDLIAVGELIRSSRLTTILGPGGLGKTRLAQEVGAKASESTPAVIFVELASVRSGDDITIALGSTLGIREVSGSGLKKNEPGERLDIRDRILSVLSERDTLLIIDNCEHIVDAAATWISDILASTATVRILTTSRSPLAISGEHVYVLDSLANGDDTTELGPAGRLFVERALSARPGVALPTETIIRLCSRLDGLPLAIELAAARVRSMTVEEIERRLNNRFALLTSGERTAPERHRTLIAVIDWSWNLLAEPERVLLRRLSRFPDGFSSQAAQVVSTATNAKPDSNSHPEDVTDALDGLVNQSLVSVFEDTATGLIRFRMLETVREFGEMALVDAGEDQRVRAAMAQWAHEFANDMMSKLTGADQVRTFRIVTSEQDNLIMVLRSAIDDDDAAVVVTVFATLAYYWLMRGAHSDAAGFGASVLRVTHGYRPDSAHLDAAIATYTIISFSVAFGDARSALLARGRLRTALRAGASSYSQIDALANVVLAMPNLDKVYPLVAQYRESSDHGLAALSSLLGAQLHENAGELEAAVASTRHAYDLALPLGNVWLQATAAQGLANLHSQRGESGLALEWAEVAGNGLRALQATSDLHQLSWLSAMNELTVAPEHAAGIFEFFVADEDGTLGVDRMDLRSIGWSGLAELALLDGRVEEGLRLYRKSVEAFGFGRSRAAPWYIIVSAACICAHVQARSGDPAIDALTRRARARLLASMRLQPEYVDMPVTGSAIIGIATWMLAPERRSGAGANEIALRLLVLGTIMGSRQDLPSLNHIRRLDAARADFGEAAVDAVRSSIGNVSPQQALELAGALLTSPEVRELFAAPPRGA